MQIRSSHRSGIEFAIHPALRALQSHTRLGIPGRAILILFLALISCMLSACTTAGPVSIRGDRFNYNMAGAESTKEQILLNLVRLRYGEPIYFLEISSMLSQYQIEAAAHGSYKWNGLDTYGPALRAAYALHGDEPSWWREYGGTLSYSDRPTISYAPLQGEQFAQQVMSPIPPKTIIHLSHSGWSIDRIMACCVQQLNGVRNDPIHDARSEGASSSTSFRRLAELFQKLQDASELGFAIELEGGSEQTFLDTSLKSDALRDTVSEIKRLLGYGDREINRCRIVSGPAQLKPDDLAVETRSVLATMYALSRRIPVPSEHVSRHEIPAQALSVAEGSDPVWLQVKYSRLPQLDPFAQVIHNGYWFYVDKSDWSSKRTFALLTYLFALQATPKGQESPLVTIGAGR